MRVRQLSRSDAPSSELSSKKGWRGMKAAVVATPVGWCWLQLSERGPWKGSIAWEAAVQLDRLSGSQGGIEGAGEAV